MSPSSIEGVTFLECHQAERALPSKDSRWTTIARKAKHTQALRQLHNCAILRQSRYRAPLVEG